MTELDDRKRLPLWVLFLPGIILIFGLPTFLGGVGIIEKIATVFIFAVVGVLTNYCLLKKGWLERLSGAVDRRPYTFFACIVFFHFTVFLIMAFVRFYSFGICGQDTAFLEQSFWNTGQGDFFYRSQPQGTGGMGGHASFIFTLIWPIYRLIPRMETLFVLRAIFISAAALPLFALARKRLGNSLGLVFVVAYLFHPIISGQCLRDIYEAHFGIVFFFGIFWAIENNRLRTFWVMLALLLLVREDYALTAALFSFYLWWRKRDWRWAVFPFPVALGWFFLLTKIILPAITGGGYAFSGLFSQWGGSFFEIGLGIISRPYEVIKTIATVRNLYYFYYLLLPFGFVLLFLMSWEFLLAIPAFLIITLCSDPRTSSLQNYYGLPIIVIVCMSSIYGLEKWGRILKDRVSRDKLYAALGVTLLVLTSWALWRLVLVPELVQGGITRPYYAGETGEYVDRNEAMKEALGKIPPGASVMLPRYLGPFAARRRMIVFDGRSDMIYDVDYIIIDYRSRDVATRGRFQSAPELVKLLDSNEVEKIFEKDGVAVYRRLR